MKAFLKLKKIRKKVSSVFPAHVCEKEKDCYKKYALSPEIINIYCDGIEKIFQENRKVNLIFIWSKTEVL